MNPTHWRLSDARFLLVLALPLVMLGNVLVDPASVALGAVASWVVIAAIDTLWPGRSRRCAGCCAFTCHCRWGCW